MASGPVTPLPVRASDLERDVIEKALRDRAVEGRISMDTFSSRLERLHQARDQEDLTDLVRDLPPRSRLARILSGGVAFVSALSREVELAWHRPRVPRLELPEDRRALTLGRSRSCGYRLSDPGVSRSHARLDRTLDGWVLDDCGSANGTRVNGLHVVGPTPVRRGDVISLGRAHIRLS